MNTLANDRAAGRETGKKVAQLLLIVLGRKADSPTLTDEAMEMRAGWSGDESYPFEPNRGRAERLYNAWDEGFWETFEAARQQAQKGISSD